MSYRFILYELSDRVATITLNRPERRNALSFALLDELTEAVRQASTDGARALVLTGAGEGFCSGADLVGDGEAMPDDVDVGALLETYYLPAVEAIADLDIPVVAAVNGAAVGAGLSFALAADIVVMARSAYLMLAFANIGLVPDAGSTWLIARSAGRAKTLEMALLGERITAEEAVDYGLATRIAEDDKLAEEARGIAVRLAAGPTKAFGLIRKQVASALDATLAETMKIEQANQTIAGRTADFREATMAFSQKRKPGFRGQ